MSCAIEGNGLIGRALPCATEVLAEEAVIR
jgi:hypothetical protein